MNPLVSGHFALFRSLQNEADKPIMLPISQSQHLHPGALSPALMSPNVQRALSQIENQPNGRQQLLALLARNCIADNTLHMQTHQGADVHYGQSVAVPGGEAANLTIRTRLNEQAQYDIVCIDLHMPAFGSTESIYLSGPPAVAARDSASPPLTPTHLAAPDSAAEVADAMVVQNNPPSHCGTLSAALLSRNALLALDQVETQPNSRHQLLALLARNGISDNELRMQSNHGADANFGQQVTQSDGAVANLTIRARLNEQDQYDIIGIDLHMPAFSRTESIHLSGLPAVVSRENSSPNTDPSQVLASTHLAARYSHSQLTEAMVRQNNPQNYSAPLPSGASGSTKTIAFSHSGSAAERLAASGSGPIRTQATRNALNGPYPGSTRLGATGSQERVRPTDDEIKALIRDPSGNMKTHREVCDELNALGRTAHYPRVSSILRDAGGKRAGLSASDEEIKARLRNPDGTLRNEKDVLRALHADELGAQNRRIHFFLRQALGGQAREAATDDEIRVCLQNPDGTLRTARQVREALHAENLAAGEARIGFLLREARARQA